MERRRVERVEREKLELHRVAANRGCRGNQPAPAREIAVMVGADLGNKYRHRAESSYGSPTSLDTRSPISTAVATTSNASAIARAANRSSASDIAADIKTTA